MKTWIKSSAVTAMLRLVLLAIALSDDAVYAASDWDYINQENWGGVCNSGTR